MFASIANKAVAVYFTFFGVMMMVSDVLHTAAEDTERIAIQSVFPSVHRYIYFPALKN